jgi:hypothetical protein
MCSLKHNKNLSKKGYTFAPVVSGQRRIAYASCFVNNAVKFGSWWVKGFLAVCMQTSKNLGTEAGFNNAYQAYFLLKALCRFNL